MNMHFTLYQVPVFCCVTLYPPIHAEDHLLDSGTKGSGWELRHLAGSPGGGGVIRPCHTLVRVNTV